MSEATSLVRDNPDLSRYELIVDEQVVSIADYRIEGTTMIVPRVETGVAFRGQGMADRLMDGLVAELRRRQLTIRPLCWFAAGYLRDHPDDADLLA